MFLVALRNEVVKYHKNDEGHDNIASMSLFLTLYAIIKSLKKWLETNKIDVLPLPA